MRRDVTFFSQGEACSGWLYVPDGLGAGQKAPAVVLANAISAVKEITLPHYAERFAAAGFAALAFDYRRFGASAGEPRNHLVPHDQQEDVRNAVTWLRYMYVYPHNGQLHFGRAIPRAWFARTQPFAVTDVITEFGKAGVTYTSDPKAGTAKAVVNFGQAHAPQQMLVRFRTPNKEPLRSATVNGDAGRIADAERGDVDIGGMSGTITVEVKYGG